MKFQLLKNFSIYRIYYDRWHTNIAPIAFILYTGPGTKVHCIYLNAPQMNTFARMKMIGILKRLKNLNVQWNPRMMFRILRVYAPEVIRVGYRTLWKIHIQRLALINYGLNSKEDFSQELLQESLRDRAMYQSKNRDMTSRTLDLFTQRGISQTEYNKTFAKLSS